MSAARPAPLPCAISPRRTAAGALGVLVLTSLIGGCSLFAPPESEERGTVVERPRPTVPPPAVAAPIATAPAGGSTALAPAPPVVEALPQPAPAGPPVSTRHYQLGPATNALVGQARVAGAHGDYLTAMSTLERAAHIEPHNPLVWIEIAKVRLASGQAVQAESVARKAVALSEGDLKTSSEAWKLVGLALRAQNRNPEAAAAEARANRPTGDADTGRAAPVTAR